MVRIRKLTPEEQHEIAARERWADLAREVFGPPEAPPADAAAGALELRAKARIGDVVTVTGPRGELQGALLRVAEREGRWAAIQLLHERRRRWLTGGVLTQTHGRPRGISRIDHPARRTYGWYVRVYGQGKARVARLFSDGRYGGISEALEAALAFHALAEQPEQ